MLNIAQHQNQVLHRCRLINHIYIQYENINILELEKGKCYITVEGCLLLVTDVT